MGRMRVGTKARGQLRSSLQGAEMLGPSLVRHNANMAKRVVSLHKLARRLSFLFNNVICRLRLRVTCFSSVSGPRRYAGARGDAEGSLAVLIVGWCDSRPPCDISCEEQLSIRYITFRHGTTEKTSLQCKVYHILCTLAHVGVAFLASC